MLNAEKRDICFRTTIIPGFDDCIGTELVKHPQREGIGEKLDFPLRKTFLRVHSYLLVVRGIVFFLKICMITHPSECKIHLHEPTRLSRSTVQTDVLSVIPKHC